MNRISKDQILTSLFWKFLENGGAQLIQFVVQIIMARLLLPRDYGIITLALVFITIASIFVESGFSTALIQIKDADEIYFSSVFYFSLLLSSVLYIILYSLAPFLANIYEMPEMVTIIRILAISVFFRAINSTQVAIVTRNLQFRFLFLRSTIALIFSGILGVGMALLGFGVWALVVQTISNQLLITLILWITLKWRPRRAFSLSSLKDLFAFSWKVLAGSILYTAYRELRNLIIGKSFEPSILGYYTRGQQFPALLVGNIERSIQSVLFPVLSLQQDNVPQVKKLLRRSIKSSAFLVFPMMTGLASVADSFIPLLLTDKWSPAIPFVQIFCLHYSLYPIQSANLEAIKGLGYSGTFLRLNVIYRISGISILLLMAPFGVYLIALGQAFVSLIFSFVTAYPIRKLLGYNYREQIIDILPSFFLAVGMATCVYSIQWLILPGALLLVTQILLGLLIYFGAAKIFKMESYCYITSTIVELLKRKKH